jgi:outer membrane lipase/esterase
MATSALASALALAGPALAATASPFSGETVFGDSLSDGGNIAIASGLPTIMRYTTNPGLTTVEDVAQFYGLALTPSLQGGTNFAYGGAGVTTNAPGTPAGVPTVTQQVNTYLAANSRLNGGELYTVFGGANDIFYHATAAAVGQFVANNSAGLNASQIAFLTAIAEKQEHVTSTETATEAYTNVTAAAAQELTLISGLQKAGARYIVVFNLPDIGRTPQAASEETLVPGTKAALTTLSTGFNGVLNAGLATAGVGVIPVNTFALLNEVLADPAKYGFVNSTVPACTTSSSLNCTRATLVTPDAYANYIFADGVHPTTTTHALFAQVVESEIIAPQQMSLLAEEPLATLEAERDSVAGQLLSDQLDPSTGLRLFATGGYVRQRFSGQASTPSAHDDDGLITAGVDYRFSPELSFGGELSGGTASEGLDGQLRRFRTDSLMGSIFAEYVRGRAYVTGQGGLGALHFNDIQRQFNIGPAVRVENGSVDGQTYSVSGSAGYWFGQPTLRAGPFVGLAYEHVRIDRYSEDGADSTAMTFGPQSRESLIGEAGARVQGALPFHGVQLRPFAEVAYAYDGEARTRDVLAGLNTMNGVFAIPGFSPDRQWGEAQAGVEAVFGGRWTASVSYEGRFAGASSSYDGGRLGLHYAF